MTKNTGSATDPKDARGSAGEQNTDDRAELETEIVRDLELGEQANEIAGGNLSSAMVCGAGR